MIFEAHRESWEATPRRRWGWGAGLEFVLTAIGVSVACFVILLGMLV